MSLASTALQGRQRSPPRLSLSSNNPFRNRATSPSPIASVDSWQHQSTMPAMLSPQSQTRPNVPSTNPFLDSNEVGIGGRIRESQPVNSDAAALAANIFGHLSLEGNVASVSNDAPPPYRPGHVPHTANASGRSSRPQRPPQNTISARPREAGMPRRLSESSIQERRDHRERIRDGRPERTNSEERRRRQRRKEREERYLREGTKEERTKKPRGLDMIDQLDVTGIYGQGLFHHDGPFDACNPYRNKKNHRAPMQAFPEGSANMALGGSGPLNPQLDLDRFHGRGEESFAEFAVARKTTTTVVNPTDRFEQVHGNESYGLGTSTFLEGAPASKSALQRLEPESTIVDTANSGGLTRKKSLAQRLRGMSTGRPRPNDLRSFEARDIAAEVADDSHVRFKAISAGGIPRAASSRENETNPFDNDYEDAFARKGAQIRLVEQEQANRPRAPSSPRANTLMRSGTSDSNTGRPSSNDGDRPTSSGGGFLNRMRSLKGGRRAKPE